MSFQSSRENLNLLAAETVTHLQRLDEKLVLAESCTGGLIAASMTTVAGVSQFFCGSMVTYRESAKSQWLDVDSSLVSQFSAESAEVTAEMAAKVLAQTKEANISLAVTGHLGPGAPGEKDGLLFVAIATRKNDAILSASTTLAESDRQQRQIDAASFALTSLIDELANQS